MKSSSHFPLLSARLRVRRDARKYDFFPAHSSSSLLCAWVDLYLLQPGGLWMIVIIQQARWVTTPNMTYMTDYWRLHTRLELLRKRRIYAVSESYIVAN